MSLCLANVEIRFLPP